MNVVDIEKLNQLISRTDIRGNDKVRWLTDFIDGREFEQQERSYSEEDMYWAMNMAKGFTDSGKSDVDINNCFEQFKKK
jgi:hypothetical protein